MTDVTSVTEQLRQPFDQITEKDRDAIRALQGIDAGRLLIEELEQMRWRIYHNAVHVSPADVAEFAAFQGAGKMIESILDLFLGEDEETEDA